MQSARSEATVQRIEYIDVARGLFIVWMVIAHALTVSGIGWDHWMQMLRPRGWASICFVMLAGYGAAAIRLREPVDRPGFAGHLWLRAFQIAAIAWASNFCSEALTLGSSGRLSLEELGRVATFREPWTISSVLIPIAVLVALLPPLFLAARRFSGWVVFLLATAIITLPGVALPRLPAIAAWFLGAEGPFALPVLTYVGLGAWAFGLGSVVVLVQGRVAIPFRAAASTGLAALVLGGWVSLLGNSLPGPVKFVVGLGIAWSLTQLPASRLLRQSLTLLGQAALLIFVLHRPIVSVAGSLALRRLSPEWTATLAIVIGLASGLALASFRSKRNRVTALLGKVGL